MMADCVSADAATQPYRTTDSVDHHGKVAAFLQSLTGWQRVHFLDSLIQHWPFQMQRLSLCAPMFPSVVGSAGGYAFAWHLHRHHFVRAPGVRAVLAGVCGFVTVLLNTFPVCFNKLTFNPQIICADVSFHDSEQCSAREWRWRCEQHAGRVRVHLEHAVGSVLGLATAVVAVSGSQAATRYFNRRVHFTSSLFALIAAPLATFIRSPLCWCSVGAQLLASYVAVKMSLDVQQDIVFLIDNDKDLFEEAKQLAGFTNDDNGLL